MATVPKFFVVRSRRVAAGRPRVTITAELEESPVVVVELAEDDDVGRIAAWFDGSMHIRRMIAEALVAGGVTPEDMDERFGPFEPEAEGVE